MKKALLAVTFQQYLGAKLIFPMRHIKTGKTSKTSKTSLY